MAKRNFLNAAIIGAGAVGSQWDELASPDQRKRQPLTHASALESIDTYKLVALCDSNPERLTLASRIRGPQYQFSDVDRMLMSLAHSRALDLLIIATPPVGREKIFDWAANETVPPIIVCEKPVATNVLQARNLAEIAANSCLQIRVPFLRRWIHACQEAKRQIVSGSLGPIQKVTAIYGKGITNNGSHMFDLLMWLFGVPQTIRTTDVVDDDRFHTNDPTLGCQIEFCESGKNNFSAHMLAVDHRAWTTFECDIMGRNGRLRLTNRCNTLEIYNAIADPAYPNYTVLKDNAPTPTHEQAIAAFTSLYTDCRQLRAQSQLEINEHGATLRDGLLAQAACMAAIDSFRQGYIEKDFISYFKEWTNDE